MICLNSCRKMANVGRGGARVQEGEPAGYDHCYFSKPPLPPAQRDSQPAASLRPQDPGGKCDIQTVYHSELKSVNFWQRLLCTFPHFKNKANVFCVSLTKVVCTGSQKY